MFGVQKLKDEIECLQEERNYFRSKFLEQVSEIASLKETLKSSEKEISRLRRELMNGSFSSPTTLTSPGDSSKRSSRRLSLKQPSIPMKKLENDETNDDDEEKKEGEEEAVTTGTEEVLSSLSMDGYDDEEDESSEEEDEDEQAAIRHKAEQLVRWTSYRQDVMTSPERAPAAQTN